MHYNPKNKSNIPKSILINDYNNKYWGEERNSLEIEIPINKYQRNEGIKSHHYDITVIITADKTPWWMQILVEGIWRRKGYFSFWYFSFWEVELTSPLKCGLNYNLLLTCREWKGENSNFPVGKSGSLHAEHVVKVNVLEGEGHSTSAIFFPQIHIIRLIVRKLQYINLLGLLESIP